MLSPVRAREAFAGLAQGISRDQGITEAFLNVLETETRSLSIRTPLQSVWLVTWGIVYIKASAYLSYKD